MSNNLNNMYDELKKLMDSNHFRQESFSLRMITNFLKTIEYNNFIYTGKKEICTETGICVKIDKNYSKYSNTSIILCRPLKRMPILHFFTLSINIFCSFT